MGGGWALRSPGKQSALRSENAAHKLAAGPFPSPHAVSFWQGHRSIERVSLMAHEYPYPSLGAPEKEGF